MADNLLDYVTKLRAGEICKEEHRDLWLAVLSQGRQWINHNKDVGKLHFKMVGKDNKPLPFLFEKPCPLGTEMFSKPPLAPQKKRNMPRFDRAHTVRAVDYGFLRGCESPMRRS